MAQIFWRELYCPLCKKVVKHRHSVKESVTLRKKGDLSSKLSKNVLDAFSNPNTEWECWACRTKGRKSIRKAEHLSEEKTDAYLTVYPREGEPKTDLDKLGFMFDKLAEVVSYLEDRISTFEKIILGKSKRRAIRIKKDK